MSGGGRRIWSRGSTTRSEIAWPPVESSDTQVLEQFVRAAVARQSIALVGIVQRAQRCGVRTPRVACRDHQYNGLRRAWMQTEQRDLVGIVHRVSRSARPR